MTQTEAFIALNMLPRVGPVRVRKLLEVFGSPEQILEARPANLRNVQGIGIEVAVEIPCRARGRDRTCPQLWSVGHCAVRSCLPRPTPRNPRSSYCPLC